MHANIFSLTYLVANGVSLAVLIAAIFRPAVARFLLSVIFIGAAFFNAFMAIREPELFMVYGRMTASPAYEQFIYGAFRDNITAIVVSISICQLVTGIFIAARGTVLRLGLIAAAVFLVAIAPLGAGSAFPSTLLLATAAIILLFKTSYLSAHPLPFISRHLS
ncbi:hypothetical protein ACTJJ0_24465 [Chitinophaga sp. 22321]|uniref:DoxX protein n=1 Tax=Chitinophaga hostae TaxID=2831022 RepID=A0ABS5J635_9BACT|nr:hypothetical protein [Chitinophaga hostae]MBS0030680.1 hypothetical protein [Chitinophaga hostae]